jgi:hypothetical protein
VGSGTIVETGGGDLVLGGNGASFSGEAVISGGVIELGASNALGGGGVTFIEPSSGSAVLRIDAADAPAAGGAFANTISNFAGANEAIDLRSIAYVSGASAKVVGQTLLLTDGGATYTFDIAGGVAAAYPVLSDGHGGTLIDPEAASAAQARARATGSLSLFVQTMAGFASAGAAQGVHATSASLAATPLFTPFGSAACHWA